jgi:hypothetical protein
MRAVLVECSATGKSLKGLLVVMAVERLRSLSIAAALTSRTFFGGLARSAGERSCKGGLGGAGSCFAVIGDAVAPDVALQAQVLQARETPTGQEAAANEAAAALDERLSCRRSGQRRGDGKPRAPAYSTKRGAKIGCPPLRPSTTVFTNAVKSECANLPMRLRSTLGPLPLRLPQDPAPAPRFSCPPLPVLLPNHLPPVRDPPPHVRALPIDVRERLLAAAPVECAHALCPRAFVAPRSVRDFLRVRVEQRGRF